MTLPGLTETQCTPKVGKKRPQSFQKSKRKQTKGTEMMQVMLFSDQRVKQSQITNPVGTIKTMEKWVEDKG